MGATKSKVYREVWPETVDREAAIMAKLVSEFVPIGGVGRIIGDYLRSGTIEDITNASSRRIASIDHVDQYANTVLLDNLDALLSFRKAVGAVYVHQPVYAHPHTKEETRGRRYDADESKNLVPLAILSGNGNEWGIIHLDPGSATPKHKICPPPRCYLMSIKHTQVDRYVQACVQQRITLFVYSVT
jgi:hypothetical protein